jgi:TRAP transporter 4TM/12TM fusion protein
MSAVNRAIAVYRDLLLAAPVTLGILWIADVPMRVGHPFLVPSYLAMLVGLGVAGAYMISPIRREPGVPEVLIGLVGFAAWAYCAYNYDDWLLTAHERGPWKIIPGVVGLILLWDGLRRTAGLGLAILVAAIFAYGLYGHYAPGVFEGTQAPADRLVLYLYSDASGVLGLVLAVIASLVLGFVVLGQLMARTGATDFFNDFSMSLVGHRRGGPAKVAVVGSSLMGMVSGSTVGNIMSTGIVSIPLMKRSGFPAHVAAGIEAVASNGSQLAPPVMGATAFLIAEFLEIPYQEVVLAALIPAALYYAILFVQVDFFARARGLSGVPKSELPQLKSVVARGWIFLFPVIVLLVLLFALSYNPAKSALIAALCNFVPWVIVQRKMVGLGFLRDVLVGTGQILVPLLMIGAAAGIVIGVINLSGLGFNLTMALGAVGESFGLVPMLVVTALVCIILGLGMPTAAVYVVVAVLLAPVLQKMGIGVLASHMFVFYFGLASMLTPPVAVASYVAAGIAKAPMGSTSIAGVTLGASVYLLPFLFTMNPALLMQGHWIDIVLSTATALISGILLARALCSFGLISRHSPFRILGPLAAGLAVGSAPIWLDGAPVPVAIIGALGLGYLLFLRRYGMHEPLTAS